MEALNVVFCIVIIGFGIVDAVFLVLSMLEFQKVLKNFERIEIREDGYEEELGTQGDLEISAPVTVRYDRKMLEDNRVNFQNLYSKYVVYSQWISLFPLLGILGTVAGLVFCNDMTDTDSLVAGLSLALLTTFLGLICSIALKFFDAAGPGKCINDIDSRFSTVDGAINRLMLEKIETGRRNSEPEQMQSVAPEAVLSGEPRKDRPKA